MQTRMVPQPQTVCKNVTETAYRQEAYVESVPVTTYKQVTVDEGGYQTVWVPKMVTKNIPQTQVQQRVGYRTVPYQYTRQVAERSVQYVPQQSVSYVPETVTASRVATCNPCQQQLGLSSVPTGWNAMAVTPQSTWNSTAWSAGPVYPSATTTAVMPSMTVPTHGLGHDHGIESPSSIAPVPEPYDLPPEAAADNDWTPIRSRTSSNYEDDRLGAWDVQSTRSTSAAAGKFVPAAPSAAAVWQSRY